MRLSDADFELFSEDAGTPLLKEPIFSLKRTDPTLVLFYSQTCESCHDYVRIFEDPKLASESGVAICALEVFSTSKAVALSRKTDTPLETVPDIFLFRKGLPPVRYPRREEVRSKYLADFVLATLDKSSSDAGPASAHSEEQGEHPSRSARYCLIDC